MPRKAKKLPYVMTEDELQLLLAQPNPKCPTGLRNLCMMKLICNAGLRVAEVLNLKVKDIDWMTGKLKVVQGKGRRIEFSG
jgi:integrase/recombinase XerD